MNCFLKGIVVDDNFNVVPVFIESLHLLFGCCPLNMESIQGIAEHILLKIIKTIKIRRLGKLEEDRP